MDDFAWPSVKCPAGCNSYVDDCRTFAFNHFLAWKFNVTIYGGNDKYLTGARSDWPRSTIDLNVFFSNPGVLVTEEGLSVMFCENHGKGLFEPIIHVPRNPVLGNMGLPYPDTTAAAILTPNVIRAGRMGKWTNSTHVINAIGGYTGISSSTISQRLDLCVSDDRLLASEFLSANHRPDVMTTLHRQYSGRLDGEKLFEYFLRDFDTNFKPDADITSDCLMGGTLVYAEETFSMHDQIFNRDRNEHIDDDANEAQSNECLEVLFVTVHPPGEFGSKPVDISSEYRLQEECITATMLRLLIHSWSIRAILLDTFRSDGNRYILKLLGFVHKCYTSANRTNANKCFRNTVECEMETANEIDRMNLDGGNSCESVVRLLTAISPDSILSVHVSTSDQLDNLPVDFSHDVLLVFRNQSRLDRSPVPLQIGEHHLMFAFGSKNMSTFFFRWKPCFYFWKVVDNVHSQTSEKSCFGGVENTALFFHQWQLLVFSKITNHCYLE